MPVVHCVVCAGKEVGGAKVQLRLSVPGTLNVFAGHFEQAPIVPGVVQVYWALALCNEYLHKVSARAIERVDALKFQQVILPGAELQLTLTLVHNKLQFDFVSGAGRHSSGKVVLE